MRGKDIASAGMGRCGVVLGLTLGTCGDYLQYMITIVNMT